MKKQLLNDFLIERAGLLCNHTAWDVGTGSYFFERLPNLQRIFVPEHGLFAELQDQVPVSDGKIYKDFGIDAEITSLYGDDKSSLVPDIEKMKDLDVLFVDLQDVGTRYFTFAVTLGYMIKTIEKYSPKLKVVITDRENPAGLQVEGSKLPPEFSSFIGWPGLPHRHGLTLGELAIFFHKKFSADFPLFILPVNGLEIRPDFEDIHAGNIHLLSDEFHSKPDSIDPVLYHSRFIPPSPNIPGPATPYVYSGQCLLEGTNLSEGRGTTRPFEQFGAPWLNPLRPLLNDENFVRFPGAQLRPIRFVPTFHKWKDEICSGFQIHLTGEPYHSLLHSLTMIRTIRQACADFSWREGLYEFGSDKTAIELLAGDHVLLNYLNGKISSGKIKEHLQHSEKEWLDEVNQYKIYHRMNTSVLL